MTASGWSSSAAGWIAAQQGGGDFARKHVLDGPMMAHATAKPPRRALDVGCGEGRFCRMLANAGIAATGLDPTPALIDEARTRDTLGQYVIGTAEALPFEIGRFDLVVSYLTLIDIDDIDRAIAEMIRVLAPGGTLLVANLAPMVTANPHHGFVEADGNSIWPVDDYLAPRAEWVAWDDIRVRNWHRPLGQYMHAFLAGGLILRAFEEPVPTGGDPARVARYCRVPWFQIMAWTKPEGQIA
ncbi:class I SAM-dependent methyltransferase [Acuticoccus sp. MNP-M23]|uniref:class I SAM-dependent methyltransferase n=1 Tax=Acuticoccus sp. MNP-M23 TaxID=3072793 RepID=UPI0028163F0B|nr:class I SAM-dependent methyltransferase [Acuticoccus sp. MNP-M23]WMS43714.1 class I SAM-dependent methyltransferase [Acuticoccus sp. MNP-M23]